MHSRPQTRLEAYSVTISGLPESPVLPNPSFLSRSHLQQKCTEQAQFTSSLKNTKTHTVFWATKIPPQAVLVTMLTMGTLGSVVPAVSSTGAFLCFGFNVIRATLGTIRPLHVWVSMNLTRSSYHHGYARDAEDLVHPEILSVIRIASVPPWHHVEARSSP